MSTIPIQPDRNFHKRLVGEYLHSDDGDVLFVIDPAWTNKRVADELGGGESSIITRTVLKRYSARQCREYGVDDFWGEDGELATWILIATGSHA